jgi:tetratricopeptide (TPR) repeat protein
MAAWEIITNVSWVTFPRDAADSARGHEMATTSSESMKQPGTPEELLALHKILRSDPQRYLRIIDKWIDEDPRNSHAYFSRHFAWMKIGEPRQALDDLNKVIELDPDLVAFRSRGEIYRFLGEYGMALEDFSRGEAIDPKQWEDDAFGVYYQADAYAHLGNELAAVSCCARRPNYFWTPGVQGAPAGGKAEIAEELRRIAADARRKRV